MALNSEVFIRAWKRVFADAEYLSAKWTVKVDPDCVFLPGRLRTLLLQYDDGSMYVNNCDEGLHGPIEVISRTGMEVFAKYINECREKLAKDFSTWGEDVFLRDCLRFLDVRKVDNFNLLVEDHCFHGDPGHMGCYPGKVAFHPFKSSGAFFQCWEQAHAAL